VIAWMDRKDQRNVGRDALQRTADILKNFWFPLIKPSLTVPTERGSRLKKKHTEWVEPFAKCAPIRHYG
jgi:hypothetical protein